MEDQRNVGESSCNFGDGTNQKVQSLMFMMMMIMMMMMMTRNNGERYFFPPNTKTGSYELSCFPPGCGDSVADFCGWDAHEARLLCPDGVSGDM